MDVMLREKANKDRARTRAIETRSSYSSTAGGLFSPVLGFKNVHLDCDRFKRAVLAAALQD